MHLAIGSSVAFRELGADLYDHPERAIPGLHWWKEQGLEGIVFYDWHPGFYEAPIERFKTIRTVLGDLGLRVPAFNTLRKALHRPELVAIEEARLDHCLAVCDILRPDVVDVNICEPFASGLNSPIAATRPLPPNAPARLLYRGDFAGDEVFVQVAKRLKRYARACAALGAKLAIELHDDGLHDTADNCLKLAKLVDEPNVGFNPDLGNWYRVPNLPSDTWVDQLRALAPQTIYWEVKNYKRLLLPEGGVQVCSTDLDEGDIDYREAAAILWQAGFRGWACNEGGSGDSVQSNVKYLTYMRGILDEWIPQESKG
jgi:sugar phosphate isomerase/epimerase